jgi:hypothetical protein
LQFRAARVVSTFELFGYLRHETLENETLETLMKTAAALKFLTKSGYKVSRATFYRHIGSGAVSEPFTEESLLLYGENFLKEKKDRRRARSADAAELKRAQIDKAKATAGYARLRTEKMRGNLIPREDIERIYAQACLRMLTAVKNFDLSAAHEICNFFKGDPNKIQDFLWIWPEYVEKWMGEFMGAWRDNGKFEVPDVSMAEILEWYEKIQASHGGRDLQED